MIEAPVNRIAQHYTTDTPLTPRERGQVYISTLQQAIETMGRLMNSLNPGLQFKAAKELIDFEKTRLRHHHSLAGMETNEPVDWSKPLGPEDAPYEVDPMDDLRDELYQCNEEPALPPGQEVDLDKLVEEAIDSLGLPEMTEQDRKCRRELLREEMLEHIHDNGFEQAMSGLRDAVNRRKTKTTHVPAMPKQPVLDWPS
jgi:hypothetical protein